MDDVDVIVSQTCDTRDLRYSFDELKELGCIVPVTAEPLVMKVDECENNYSFRHENIYVKAKNKWIPASLKYLYSIQSFLNRRIVLETYEDTTISAETLAMMNELLENQRIHKIYTSGISFDKDVFYNDGVNTYSTSGLKVAMTREEFIKKHPGSYEVQG